MITEKELQDAITECLTQANPNANTCIKLAAFYTIKDQLYPKPEEPEESRYAFSAGKQAIQYSGDSDFAKAIEGKDPGKVFSILDQFMGVLELIQPRLYKNLLQNLFES